MTGRELRVLDVHHHLAIGEDVGGQPDLTVRLRIMDEFGIDRACLMPPSGAFGGRSRSMQEINDQTARLVDAQPERFPAGLAHIDLDTSEADSRVELARAVSELGLRGAVWHHRFQGTFLDHPHMPALLRTCADLGVPAFIHVVSSSNLEAPWRLERLLDTCPDTTIVVLDAFSSDRAGEITNLAKRFDRVHCDLGAMSSAIGWLLQEYLDTIGADRLLLGTDLYVAPRTYYFPYAISEVLHLPVPFEVKQGILADNALRILGVP